MKLLLFLLAASVIFCTDLIVQAEPAKAANDSIGLVDSLAAIDLNRVQLFFTTDQDPVDYQVGEEMVFSIAVDLDGQTLMGAHFIDWKLSSDDGASDQGRVNLSEQPIVIQTSISRPGFVRLQAELVNAKGVTLEQDNRDGSGRKVEIAFEGGAGAAVAQIRQAAPAPADFAAFWKHQRKRLNAVSMESKVEKVESKRPGFDTFAVTLDCAGSRPVTGYLTIPTGAANHSLPASCVFSGYGVQKQSVRDGTDGEITFFVNAHGFDLDRDEGYYLQYKGSIRSHGENYGFDPKQNSDPEEAYFNGMAMRVMRALDFVKLLPQWNGEALIVKGGSQGGLQSVWAAALDHDVSLCQISIIWCANIAGASEDERLRGWQPKWVPELGYYDVVNHAQYIQCPVEIERAGLGDYISPPSGIAAFYNNLNVSKRIVWYQGSTHGYVSPRFKSVTRSAPAMSLNQN